MRTYVRMHAATTVERSAGWRRTNMAHPWYGEVRTLVGALCAPWVYLGTMLAASAAQRSSAALPCVGARRGAQAGLQPDGGMSCAGDDAGVVAAMTAADDISAAIIAAGIAYMIG